MRGVGAIGGIGAMLENNTSPSKALATINSDAEMTAFARGLRRNTTTKTLVVGNVTWTQDFADALIHNRTVTELILKRPVNAVPAEVEAFKSGLGRNVGVRTLVLHHLVPAREWQALAEVVGFNETLATVKFVKTTIARDDARAFFDAVSRNTELRGLRFSSVTMQDAVLSALGDAVREHPTLVELVLDRVKIDWTDRSENALRHLSHLVECVSSPACGLETLDVSRSFPHRRDPSDPADAMEAGRGTAIGYRHRDRLAWETFARCLTRIPRLRVLRLCENVILAGDRNASGVGRLLKRAHGLEELDLSDCRLEAGDVQKLMRNLAGNGTLRKLNLNRINSLASAVPALCERLASDSTLEELSLEGTFLEPEDTVKIVRAVATNRGLRTLDVSKLRASPEVALEVAKMLETNVHLQTLRMTNLGRGFHIRPAIREFGAIGKALGKNRTLLELDLSDHLIAGAVLEDICEGAAPNATLRTLILRNVQLTWTSLTPGKTSLAQFVSTHPALTTLGVDFPSDVNLRTANNAAAWRAFVVAIATRITERVTMESSSSAPTRAFDEWRKAREVSAEIERIMLRTVLDTSPRVPSAVTDHDDIRNHIARFLR